MKNLILIITLLCAFSATAAQRITATITVTNRAVTGDTLTVNASARYWTNANSSSTILTNLVGKNETTTNLYNQIASYPYSGPIALRYSTTNVILLTASLDGALAVTAAGTWATVSLSTQSGPQTYTGLWPLENIVGDTNRTNQGSAFVYGLSTYSTQAFATNSAAISNALQKGAGPLQRVVGPVQFGGQVGIATALATNLSLYNATNRGYVVALTNGYWTNAVLDSATITNVNLPGSGLTSVEINGTASGDFSAAIGGTASGYSSTAIGIGATASAHGAVSLGTTAAAAATNALALGTDASAQANNSIALGASAGVADADSVAIGTSALSTATNQIMLGSSSYTVAVPGVLSVSGSQTNTTFTGTNVMSGRLDLTPRSNTALANGYNSGVVLGTNVYIRFSGPTGAYTNAGFAAAVDGTYHVAQFANPGLSFTILDNSGTEATAENRIYTGSGSLLNSTNNPVMAHMIYDGSVSRWRVVSFR